MKKIFNIFRQDLKSVTRNLIIFAVVIGITILPALYAWFNIASNWDPYINTGDLSFAVCTLDKGYNFKGLDIKAGDKIVEGLKANPKMGWDFVDSEEEAQNGVEDGKYYAAVVIPANFSENLLSITNGKFNQAKLQYYVNEKTNAIAPKITDKGIEAIQESVDATYVSTIAESIAKILNVTNEELKGDKVKLAEKLKTSLTNAKSDIDSAKESIDLLIATLDSIADLIKTNQNMLPKIQSAITKAGVVAGDIKSTLQATQNTTQQLTSTIQDLIDSGDAHMQNISSSLNDAFANVSGDANAVADKLGKVKTLNQTKIELNNRLISVFQRVQDNLGIDCSKAIARLNKANDKQQAIIDKINSICDNIKNTGKIPENAKSELDSLVSQANNELSGLKTEYSTLKGKIDNAISTSFSSLDKISEFTQSIDVENGDLSSAFKTGLTSVDDLKNVLTQLKAAFDKLNTKVDNTIKRIGNIENDDSLESMLLPIIENPESLGEFISAPVSYDRNRVFPVENYGSAMAPFYSSLALWVGGVVLVAVLNVELTPKDRKRLGKANSTQMFFGRYLMFFFLSEIQALIIALGDLFFLKIQCDNMPLFIISCLISSFVYSLIIYSLTITFSVIGKALAVIILILQVAGSGGTFPIELLPAPYQAIAPFLPFKYGINAIRETVAGLDMNVYLKNMGMLLLFVIPALLVGLLLRKPCIKIMNFFNRKIEQSDLII